MYRHGQPPKFYIIYVKHTHLIIVIVHVGFGVMGDDGSIAGGLLDGA